MGHYASTILGMGVIKTISFSQTVQQNSIDLIASWEFRENLTEIVFEIWPDHASMVSERACSVYSGECTVPNVIPGAVLRVRATAKLYDVLGESLDSEVLTEPQFSIDTVNIHRTYDAEEVTLRLPVHFRGFIDSWQFHFDGYPHLDVHWGEWSDSVGIPF